MLAKIFCDGASSNNQNEELRVGGYAAVLYLEVKKGNVLSKEIGNRVVGATNNQMELMAILEGLKAIPSELRQETNVNLQSDSAYAVNIFNNWIAGWKKNGWKKKKGDIENLSIIQEIDALLPLYKGVTIERVNRCSNTWITKADSLASGFAGSRS